MEPLSGKDERMWAMFCHLSALAILLGIPFGNVIGPLVVWLIYREQSPLVEANGRAALNFQITMSIAMIIASVSIFCLVGVVLLPAIVIVDVVYTILAAVAANEGKVYLYPAWATFEFIK